MCKFPMLTVLGRDVPGAIRAVPAERDPATALGADAINPKQGGYRISLAGFQMKFSALKKRVGFEQSLQ